MFVKDIPRTDLDGRIEDEDNGAGTKADTVPTSTIPTSIFIEANIARDLVLAQKKVFRGVNHRSPYSESAAQWALYSET